MWRATSRDAVGQMGIATAAQVTLQEKLLMLDSTFVRAIPMQQSFQVCGFTIASWPGK